MSDIELHDGGIAAVGSRSSSKRICSPRLTCEFAPSGPSRRARSRRWKGRNAPVRRHRDP
jgi:hypothetical protein